MNSKNKFNIFLGIGITLVILLALGWISNNNNPTIEKKNINEYTKEDIEFYKKWYGLQQTDIILYKSQTRQIFQDFYNVQRGLLLKNMRIKYNNFSSPRPFSELINEFDPEFVKYPNQSGVLGENNIVIVRKKNFDYSGYINSPTKDMLYLYEDNAEPILILDDKTMIIKYANFGGYDYSYRNIEYID
ncbi:hypothetical protein BROC_00194 [Candidatus Brocadiaceae bacterium]|nr:hypothetical protein BROC_00194 [Candidatus Brocadiaceae bacterium]